MRRVFRVRRSGEIEVGTLPRVEITVTCECGAALGTWTDVIDEKYPFWCEDCGEYKHWGKWPWKLTTRILA